MSGLADTIPAPPIAAAVDAHLEQHGLDVEQFADRAGVPSRSIRRIRAGERVTIDLAERLAIAMDSRLDELIEMPPPAEVDPRRGNRHVASWTREVVLERMAQWSEQFGQPPSAAEWNVSRARRQANTANTKAQRWLDAIAEYERGDWPSADTVERLFGSWNAAMESAGYPKRPKGRTPNAFKVRHQYQRHGDALADLRFGIAEVERAGKDKDAPAMRQAVQDLASICLAWLNHFEGEKPAKPSTHLEVPA